MRNEKIKLTLLYNSFLAFAIRTAALNILAVIIILNFIQGVFPQVPLFLLSILVMLEIFIKFISYSNNL